jgi:hypothetical protein
MTPIRVLLAVAAIISVLALAMPGCSDKTFTSNTTITNPGTSAVTYLPLEDGWRISYVLLQPESGQFNIEVADPVMVAGNPGFTIRKTDPATGYTTVFYRYAKGEAIFESYSLREPGLRILESPYAIGNSWDRNDTTTTNPVIIDFPIDTGDGDGGVTLKPQTNPGYSIMSIVSIEDVQALNNITYGHCIKVAWQTGPSTCNYYWYAPGIGLVKFQQDVDLFGSSTDYTLGVMSDYQRVIY